MRDYAAEAVRFSQGRSREDLDTDRMFMLATCRLLEMLGEAACQIPQPTRDTAPQVPWSQIIGLRHRLVHAYDQINLDIIWNIVTVDLPPLIIALEASIGRTSDHGDAEG
ncbi:MAG TPA: HepT-like ribonuclease domain-containing protein [Isosphaeraceae bacterium]